MNLLENYDVGICSVKKKTDLHPFRSNTGYKPASTCHTLENYIDLTKLELSFLPIERNVKNNLTKGERIALRNLKNDETIVIKKADKNSNCVILDRLDYITEVTRQLNTQHYCQLDSFNMAELKIQVIEYIKSLYDQGIIDKISFKFLTNGQKLRDARLGRIYILPKIHRLETETFKQIQHDGLNELNIIPPGRPIISHNTGYKPASTCHTLENYIDLTKLELSFLPIERNVKNNLTKGERIALRNLKNDETIVIKKADKNSNCVILDRLDYITEVTRQLNTQHYCQLDSFNMAELKIQVIEYIKSLYDQGIIDKYHSNLTNGQKLRDAIRGEFIFSQNSPS
ncbi:unnamed protein product [Mytilus edulis]|uniref:Uncharacterized protein n=1 Tax=Mytilus edulis TaxID=6550 RepID=A0A8S3QKB0_MYTED|nr:unnamed protein product [Mytilus edulis]